MTPMKQMQAGFSLLSVLIASTIGIFLIGGAGKVYVDSKNAFNARTSIAVATENYRFAFQDMRRAIVMAGRSISPEHDSQASYASDDNGLRTFPDYSETDSGNVIVDIDENGSSIIAVRYASGPAPCGMRGTLGATPEDPVTVRFYVENGDLICQVPEEDIAQPLVSGITRMRALYGIDTDVDGIANKYLTAAAVEEGNLWYAVVAIRVGIVSSSGAGQELPAAYQPDTATQKDLLGYTYTTPDTHYPYKSANTTIALRNLNNVMNRQVGNRGE